MIVRHVTVPLDQLVMLLLDDSGTKAKRNGSRPVPFPAEDFVPDLERGQLGCPLCGGVNTLYENVELTGWVTVSGHRLERDGDKTVVRPINPSTTSSGVDREADWDSVEHTGFACNVCCGDGENLTQLALVCEPKKGWDGEPLRPPMRGQERLIPDRATHEEE